MSLAAGQADSENVMSSSPPDVLGSTPDVFGDYIRIELELGFTFASIATHARTEEKFTRNREHVRRVCQSARHLMHLVPGERKGSFCRILGELEYSLRNLDRRGGCFLSTIPR